MNTEIIVITDSSGSMGPLRNSVVDGYNKFLTEQKSLAGDARVTFVRFNHNIWPVYVAASLNDVPLLAYEGYPVEGMTALNDAIGQTLEAQGKRIAEEKWAENVIVVIITDGHENSSTDYTAEQIKTMITHAEKHEWKFIFLGANQDSFQTASIYGINPVGVANFQASSVGTQSAYNAISGSVLRSRAGGSHAI